MADPFSDPSSYTYRSESSSSDTDPLFCLKSRPRNDHETSESDHRRVEHQVEIEDSENDLAGDLTAPSSSHKLIDQRTQSCVTKPRFSLNLGVDAEESVVLVDSREHGAMQTLLQRSAPALANFVDTCQNHRTGKNVSTYPMLSNKWPFCSCSRFTP